MTKCCDEWWNRLDKHMKEWVHYYFWEIERELKDFTPEDIHKMHEFRFKVEGGLSYNDCKRYKTGSE